MRWAALVITAGLLVAGCGDTGVTKEEFHDAYARGYAAGESTGRTQAEASTEEEGKPATTLATATGKKKHLKSNKNLKTKNAVEN